MAAYGHIHITRTNISKRTAKAICLDISGGSIWLPLSLVDIEEQPSTPDYHPLVLHMPFWLAKRSGLTGWDCYGSPVFHLEP